MEKAASLQRANQEQRLTEWSQRVEACRSRRADEVQLLPARKSCYAIALVLPLFICPVKISCEFMRMNL